MIYKILKFILNYSCNINKLYQLESYFATWCIKGYYTF